MTAEFITGAPDEYYDNPWLPSEDEMKEWDSLVLSPQEAQFLLTGVIGSKKKIPTEVREALETIRDGDEEKDFINIVKDTRDGNCNKFS